MLVYKTRLYKSFSESSLDQTYPLPPSLLTSHIAHLLEIRHLTQGWGRSGSAIFPTNGGKLGELLRDPLHLYFSPSSPEVKYYYSVSANWF